MILSRYARLYGLTPAGMLLLSSCGGAKYPRYVVRSMNTSDLMAILFLLKNWILAVIVLLEIILTTAGTAI